MIRKFTLYAVLLATVFLWSSCEDDEVGTPPTSSFTVDENAGLAFDTEFTFEIQEVDADAISLLPYGEENPTLGGILVKDFENGVATVKFKYQQVGTFNAVVVTTNFNAAGDNVKRTSATQAITITSDDKEISEFTFEKSTETVINQVAKTITVTVPFGTDVTKLKAKFSASPFSTVRVGSAEQESGTTENSFASPVVYTVSADDGSSSNYTVTVNVTPIETLDTFKSFKGTLTSKAVVDREVPAYIDNSNRNIVIYDVYGTASNRFDSVEVAYETDGKFGKVKYNNKALAQDQRLDLTSAKDIVVFPQDSVNGTTTYKLYAVAAPKLNLSFEDLNPVVVATSSDFDITANVLAGTSLDDLDTYFDFDLPAGVTVSQVRANDVVITSGAEVDYTDDVTIEATVVDTNIGVTYIVTYNVVVNVVP